MLKKILFALFAVLFMFTSTNIYSYGEYNTPDSWSMHVTPGGFKESYQGLKLGNTAILNLNLTSRYRLRANEYDEDQDFYQYFRGNINNIKLGQGSIYASFFLRAADDINGREKGLSDGNYHFYDDSLDSTLDRDNLEARLYHGEVTFDNVIPGAKVVLGRQYVSHLETVQIDGADISYKINDKITIFGFSGGAVSYFNSWDDDWVHGGGIEFKPFNKTKVRAEYIRTNVEDYSDDIFNLRADQVIPFGNLYAQFGNIDNAESLQAGGIFRINKTNTTFNLKYEGIFDEVRDDTGYVENPLTYALLPYGKYNLYNFAVYQGILEHLVVGAGLELRDANGREDFFNRDYAKYFGSIDIIDFPTKGTYMSFFTEKWETDDNKKSSDEDKMQLGARISQQITPALDVYAGTEYYRYKYDFVSFDYLDTQILRGRKRESVRTYYIGTKWEASKRVNLILDCNMENADVFDNEDFENNYTLEAWLNIIL